MKRVLSHICVILSLVTLTFLVLNQFNPSIFGKVFFHIELLIYVIAVYCFRLPSYCAAPEKAHIGTNERTHPRSDCKGKVTPTTT